MSSQPKSRWNNPNELYNAVYKASQEMQRKANAKFEAEYQKAIEPAKMKYLVTRQKADKVYDRTCSPARDVRLATIAPSLKAYNDAKEAAQALLKRQKRKVSDEQSKIRRKALDAYEQVRRAAITKAKP